jgi:uncharacterized protein HemX
MTTDHKERAHNEGAEIHREDEAGDNGGTVSGALNKAIDLADKAVDEVVRLTKTAFDGDNTSKVAAGATLGAVAGIVLPIISVPVAAILGAGYVAHRQSQKSDDAQKAAPPE